MPSSKRVTGATLSLTLGTPGVEHKCDITSWEFTNDEKDQDVVTFCDVEEGNDRTHFLTVNLVQSLASASFWRYLWEHAREEDVAFTVAPHGNASPSDDEPHLVGTLTVGPKPSLGGEAGKTNDFTTEVVFEIDGEPTLDTGA